jgi:hypothetical protein
MEPAMGDFTKHQQKIIKNYYDNRESISLQKVQEFVTELYLSEGKKRAKYWKSIAAHLEKLGVDKKTVDHLISQDKPELVASLVKKLMDKSLRKAASLSLIRNRASLIRHRPQLCAGLPTPHMP